jgi:hypothetical protein
VKGEIGGGWSFAGALLASETLSPLTSVAGEADFRSVPLFWASSDGWQAQARAPSKKFSSLSATRRVMTVPLKTHHRRSFGWNTPAEADYQSAAGYQPVVMSLRLTNGDENPA